MQSDLICTMTVCGSVLVLEQNFVEQMVRLDWVPETRQETLANLCAREAA